MPKTIRRKLAEPNRQVKPSTAKAKRTTGRKLQNIRLGMWLDDPHCKKCDTLTQHPYGYEIDHKTELQDGGQDIPENRQLLCITCHKEKTEERQRNGYS